MVYVMICWLGESGETKKNGKWGILYSIIVKREGLDLFGILMMVCPGYGT